MSACDRRGCEHVAEWRPHFVLPRVDGVGARRLSFAVNCCDAHRRALRVDDFTSTDGWNDGLSVMAAGAIERIRPESIEWERLR